MIFFGSAAANVVFYLVIICALSIYVYDIVAILRSNIPDKTGAIGVIVLFSPGITLFFI